MKYLPRSYQTYAFNYIIENKNGGLFLDMGLGKTVITLTAIDELMFNYCEIQKVLVIAPLMVANLTWPAEVKKWDHLKDLRLSVITGTEKQRIEALNTDADVYIINRENTQWLIYYYNKRFPFDMLVVDELSSYKNANTARFKAIRKILLLAKRRVGLTGTPAPNGLLDLWSEMYILDLGERLGKTLGQYREAYFFEPGYHNEHYDYTYTIRPEASEKIYKKIEDICITMKTEDYVDLPERIDHKVKVNLSTNLLLQYKEFEKDLYMSVDNVDIDVVNAAVLTNKLLQFCNGAIYDEEKEVHVLHDKKLIALEELIEEAVGKPVLVFYYYKHDRDRILKHLSKYNPVVFDGKEETIKSWNDGKICVMLVHPMSAGHGLNLQEGGNIIIWFCCIWSLEQYLQANKRIHRPGQLHVVHIYHILVENTIDEDVLSVLEQKNVKQEDLVEAIRAKINDYKNKYNVKTKE